MRKCSLLFAAFMILPVYTHAADMQEGKPVEFKSSAWTGNSYWQNGVRVSPASVNDAIKKYPACAEELKKAQSLKAASMGLSFLAILAGVGAGLATSAATDNNLPAMLLACTGGYCLVGIPGLIVGISSTKKIKNAVSCYNQQVSGTSSLYLPVKGLSLNIGLRAEF